LVQLLDLAALDPGDLLGREVREITLVQPFLEAQPTQSPAE
jgi:hypothetical protein